MIWIANFLLILCYVLLGRKRFGAGWAMSIGGNSIYLVLMLRMHRLDLAFLPAIFTVLAVYNLWKSREPLNSTN